MTIAAIVLSVVAIVIVCIALFLSRTQVPLSTQPNDACSAQEQAALSVSMDAGSGWGMCWDVVSESGLRLQSVKYTTPSGQVIPVLAEVGLAQIDVPYDNGVERHVDMPGFGFLTQPMNEDQCRYGELLTWADREDIVCAKVETVAPRYEWFDYDFHTGAHSADGQCLTLSTVTPQRWYTYITKVSLCDDGSILLDVGAGGTLSPDSYGDAQTGGSVGAGDSVYRLSHFHNVFWRMEFSLGDEIGNIDVAQIDDEREGATHNLVRTDHSDEWKAQVAENRWWLAESKSSLNGDGRPLAYRIETIHTQPYRTDGADTFTDSDFYVSNHADCEALAVDNKTPGCPEKLPDFLNGESLDRPVVWVQNSFHHVPRDEDEPVMNEHWQRVRLLPQGITATNELYRG